MYELEFQLTEQHVTLLRNAYVNWDDCEFGAPAINCKRCWNLRNTPAGGAR